MHYVTITIHDVRIGDTVIHNGHTKTVSRSDFGGGDFMGLTLFGDSFKMGHEPIQKVIFPKFYQGKRIN